MSYEKKQELRATFSSRNDMSTEMKENGKPLLCPDQRLDIRACKVKPIFFRNVGVANSCRVIIEISHII